MGSGSSKPGSAPSSKTSAESGGRVAFSQELMESLQSSTESDSTRAKRIELHIQSRVAEELKALQDRASKDFEDVANKLSAQESSSSDKKSAGEQMRDLGRDAVQNDVQQLRKKLESRKKLADVGERVESAKSELVKCLRENDRRPLDCWKEVQTFKDEVRKLEGSWVEKIVR